MLRDLGVTLIIIAVILVIGAAYFASGPSLEIQP